MNRVNLKLKGAIVSRFEKQVNFATAIKEDETYVSRIVQGRRRLPVEKQERWASFLGQKREDLFEDA
jgi:hypothetical protein